MCNSVKFDNNWTSCHVRNVKEHRFSWNKCSIIYPTNAEKNDAACHR